LFFHWAGTKQIEEESLAQEIVDKIKLIGESKGGYFHLDMFLSGLTDAEIAGAE